MKNYYEQNNGYQETIQKGLKAARHLGRKTSLGKHAGERQIKELKEAIRHAEAVVVGAGAGLSTSAGLTYNGERFEQYFSDFAREYGIKDMYSGGFYPFPDRETFWGWWARHIYYNRYVDPPKPVYKELLSLLKEKDYFVLTTNVDHQFQRGGFDKARLFYTQGDYGLFQKKTPDTPKTYDNEEWVMQAMEAQGFVQDAKGRWEIPKEGSISMKIPTELIPRCPEDGSEVTTNLRVDSSFVEDEGWHKASETYRKFLKHHERTAVLFLELGVGANTPVIIKYPFWQMVMEGEKASYACINYGEAFCPTEIENRSICINGDIGDVLHKMTQLSVDS